MLFRRFMWVTVLIALGGIGLLTLIQATHPQTAGFQADQRLLQWQKFDAERACTAHKKHCTLIRFTPSRV